jgi:hypothetical protein
VNVDIYGHNKQWLMIDCGLSSNVPLDREKDDTVGIMRYNMVTVDISVIANRRDSLWGIVDFIGKLAALIPSPRIKLTRFGLPANFVVFAPNSELRPQVTTPPKLNRVVESIHRRSTARFC